MGGGPSVTRVAALRNPTSISWVWDSGHLWVSFQFPRIIYHDNLSIDWECPKCNNLNYARRDRCNRNDCDFEKKDLKDYGSCLPEQHGAGEWECPRCKNLNFNDRKLCNGQMDGDQCGLVKPDFDKWGVKPVRDNQQRRPGDWDCWR